MFCKYCGKENLDGVKFCTSCGKPLEYSGGTIRGQSGVQISTKIKKITSIITIVAGALAVLIGLIDIEYDWGIVSLACGSGLLVAGILSVLKRSTKMISIIEIVFGSITLLIGFACNLSFDWGYVGVFSGCALLVVGILELLKKSCKVVSIIRIVFGGILLLFTSTYDWGLTSLIVGAQFMINGILALVDAKR